MISNSVYNILFVSDFIIDIITLALCIVYLFKTEYLEMVSKIKSDEYYINMMIAWYFATALAKQYEETIPYIENQKLDEWVHNKTIQKAIESYRITQVQKEYLKTLKRK